MSSPITPADRSLLSQEAIVDIARMHVEIELQRTASQSRPVAILLAGQSGAGKSTVASEIAEVMGHAGGFIRVDADEMRHRLPYYDAAEVDAPGASAESQVDAGRLASAVRDEAIRHNRNILVDGTLRDPEGALRMARTLRDAGYRVELHALSVNEQISYERATMRYERGLQRGLPARMVPKEWHDRSYAGMAESVRRLEYMAAVDRVAVYNRVGDTIHDAAPIAGQVAAGPLLERARAQLTDFERVSLAEQWDAIADKMEQRGAPDAHQRSMLVHWERAHYSLRSSAAAANHYDQEHPAESYQSEQLAARYGQKLVAAFRDSNPELAQELPEIRPAIAARVAYGRSIASQLPEKRRALTEQFDQTLAAKLVKGETIRMPGQSPIERQFAELKAEVKAIMDSFEIAQSAGMSLNAEDRRELRDAQVKLEQFVKEHAPSLTRLRDPAASAQPSQRDAPPGRPRSNLPDPAHARPATTAIGCR